MQQTSLTDLLNDFNRGRGWTQFHSPKNLAMAISAEAGELLSEFRWLSEEESSEAIAPGDLRDRVKAEVADVAIFLLLLADGLAIDIDEAVRTKVRTNKQRFPLA